MTRSRRITVRGIIIKDRQILAQQLTPDSDGKIRDYWCTPGGGLEPGESLHQGLHREMIEETAIAPKIGKLLFVQQYQDTRKEFIEFFFHIENAEDYTHIDLSIASHGELEIAHVDFIDPRKYNLLPAFLQTEDIESYVSSHQPVFIYNALS